MQASMFNVQVPLPGRGETFLMNTLSDAQVVVSSDVAALPDRLSIPAAPVGAVGHGTTAPVLTADEREALGELATHGFVVPDRETDRQSLDRFFTDVREDTSLMRVTVLTTLQCNFACDYCFQGDHGDYNKFAHKMTLETVARVAAWVESRLDAVHPERFSLTFFGGEPLLNLPVMYDLAERTWQLCHVRGIEMLTNVITNGLLLTPDVVDRLLPFGLNGVKITLDGDRETHDRMRPLRGGQGTFDRIIDNVRRVADRCQISIGGNFDASSVDSYPALLDFLTQQDFASSLVKVAFKPIVKATPSASNGLIPLTPVAADGNPLNGTCMTSAGAGGCRRIALRHL